jgi:hypothetical protein
MPAIPGPYLDSGLPPGDFHAYKDLLARGERGQLATPEATAAQIWSVLLDETTNGKAVPVGAVPSELINK